MAKFSVDEFYSTKANSFFGDDEGGEPSSLFQPASLVSLKNVSQYPAFDYIATNWNTSNPKGPSGGQAWNVEFVADPYLSSDNSSSNYGYTDGEVGNTDTMVLKVHYPEGSYSGNNEGGITFWSRVIPKEFRPLCSCMISPFSKKFDFVKGGKLPGFYGNKDHSTFGSCSGGKHSVDCLSTRLMWRTKGEGEVYAYIPTYDGLCVEETLGCNAVYGMSVSRGSYKFDTNKWNTIALLISLNTPNSNVSNPMLTTNNGLVALYHDDELAMYHDNLVLRTDKDMALTAVDFTTFFGGSAKSWATGKGGADTFFRNMKVRLPSVPIS
ncbi:polysaccharide lyase family 14 protein [Atractiella rhizophila]|nr:polysaccharide lyase family 14 protein [Atractiella rhizophila]